MPRKAKKDAAQGDAAAPDAEGAPVATAEPEMSEKDKEFQTICDEDCTVCYEKKGEDSGLLACNHSFCFNCIKRWSETETACPLCKVRFAHIDRIRKTSKGKQKFSKRKVVVRGKSQAEAYRTAQHNMLDRHLFVMFIQSMLNRHIFDHDDEDDEDYNDDDNDDDFDAPNFPFFPSAVRMPRDNRGTVENPISLVDDDDVEMMGTRPSRQPTGIIDLTADEDGREQSQSSSTSSSDIPPSATEISAPSSSSSSSSMAVATYIASYSVDEDSGVIRRVRRRLT